MQGNIPWYLVDNLDSVIYKGNILPLYDIKKPNNSYFIMETFGRNEKESHYLFMVDFMGRNMRICVR